MDVRMMPLIVISTHAFRVESDAGVSTTATPKRISIHARRAEGDCHGC